MNETLQKINKKNKATKAINASYYSVISSIIMISDNSFLQCKNKTYIKWYAVDETYTQIFFYFIKNLDDKNHQKYHKNHKENLETEKTKYFKLLSFLSFDIESFKQFLKSYLYVLKYM